MKTSDCLRPLLAGALLLAGGAAGAQEITAAAPCSGFLCLFSPHKDSAPARPSAPPPDTPRPVAAAAEPAALPVVAPPIRRPRPAVVRAAPVTIAANTAEIAKLGVLRTALPGAPVRFLDANRSPAAARADFTLAASMDQPTGTGSARLFGENLLVVAGGAIQAIADLRGKVVSFGPSGSPGAAVARRAFQLLGVSVVETPLDFANAADGLATGDVDALVLVAPEPAVELRILHAAGLHLLPWPAEGELPNGAATTTLTSDAYPRLIKAGESLRALRVDAVLTMNPRASRRVEARRFLAALTEHAAALSKHGLMKADKDADAHRRFASAAEAR